MVAPARARRPGAARGGIEPPTEQELTNCPFCGGREDRTPPETLVLGDPWRVRVVPNLYPAFEHQEVVIHSREHVRSFAELPEPQLHLVAEAWRLRARAARAVGFPYLHALVNEGREAGASLPHSHSQLVWMRSEPPAVVAEDPAGVSEVLGREELVVAERDGVVAVCHPAGRAPYELVIAPREPEPSAFESARLATAVSLLAAVVGRLRRVEGPVPWNAWLHERSQANGAHWHLEVLPRLSVAAGIELGAGIYVNSVAPEDGAAALRAAAGA